jgi:hypothetical protein
MQATRQALRAAGQVSKYSAADAIHAPYHFKPGREAPSPVPIFIGGIVVGTVFAMTYKVSPAFWSGRVCEPSARSQMNSATFSVAELFL